VNVPGNTSTPLRRLRIVDGRLFADIAYPGENSLWFPKVSDDLGKTWQPVGMNILSASPAQVHYLEGKLGYAQVLRKVYMTRDAGRTWTFAADIPSDFAGDLHRLRVTGPLFYAPRKAGGWWVAELESPVAVAPQARAGSRGSSPRAPRPGLVNHLGRIFFLDGRAATPR
jgi:hypothetical protein